MLAGEGRLRAWRTFNAEIGKLNQDHIDDCDIVWGFLFFRDEVTQCG